MPSWDDRQYLKFADERSRAAGAIVEWLRGSGLRPYLEALEASERAAYLQDYTAAIERAYPPRRDGRRLFPFPRLFMVIVK